MKPIAAALQVDTHAHVFARDLPLASIRRYSPATDATVEQYLGHLDAHGLSHGVLVQPSFLGSDNAHLLTALRAHPQRLRGVAMVDVDVTPAQLQELDDAGVVGIRLNLVGGAEIPDFSSVQWRRLLTAIAQRRWLVELHREACDLSVLLPVFLDAGISLVIDHYGRPDPQLGIDDPGFRYLLEVAATQRVWVKLSAAYRNGANGSGDTLAAAALPLLTQAFGLPHLLWGSDWPHTQHEQLTDYAREFQRLCGLLPAISEREQVLSTAAASLYRLE